MKSNSSTSSACTTRMGPCSPGEEMADVLARLVTRVTVV